MSQRHQALDELQTPPLLAQITSILMSILVSVGSAAGIFMVLPENFHFIILITFCVVGLIGYYLTISCLSRLLTGSWDKYPKIVKNIDMSD